MSIKLHGAETRTTLKAKRKGLKLLKHMVLENLNENSLDREC